jgi:hypothetical protein
VQRNFICLKCLALKKGWIRIPFSKKTTTMLNLTHNVCTVAGGAPELPQHHDSAGGGGQTRTRETQILRRQAGGPFTFPVHSCAFGCNLKRCKRTGRRTKSINVMAKNPCAFGCNLERCKRTGRRTISINVAAKNPRKLRTGNLWVFDLEEIRQLVYPHSSFTC